MRLQVTQRQWRKHKAGTIALCMIMKNEEKRLARCLKSVRGLVNEITITDTGSTDRSIDIARSFGAKIASLVWNDDFSAARNHSITMAGAEWILVLDPDEIISPKDHHKIKEYTADDRYSAYRFHTRNYSKDMRQQGFQPNPNDYEEGKGWPGFIPSTKTRLFRNGLGIHFKGVWHELVDWYLEIHDIPVATVHPPVHHFEGEITQKNYKEKALFYNRLGLKKVQQWPTNPQAWHELFVSYMVLGDYRKAAYCAAKSLRNGRPIAGKMFSQARALNEIGAKDLGKLAFEKGVCLLYPNLTHFDKEKKTLKDLVL